jgi:superfamily II DNA/RNA helicase
VSQELLCSVTKYSDLSGLILYNFDYCCTFCSFLFLHNSQKNILQIETCRKVENALKRFDRKGSRMQVLPFHAAMTQESRLASMKEFTRSPSKEVSQFMICTDRYSSV